LDTWVKEQRHIHKTGKLSLERKARLHTLQFTWNPKSAAWEAMFAELNCYRERFGDCNVPKKWPENPELGAWVGTQRIFDTKGWLSADRKRRLNDLGFVWRPKGDAWENMFAELQRYKKRFGDCDVPVGWKENPKLARWVLTQRSRAGELPPERKARLNEVSFIWTPQDSAWENMFAELKRYRDSHGDCNVSKNWESPLGRWVNKQRALHERGVLTSERKTKLDSLGFVWGPQDAAWEARFIELKRFKDQHGHCNVSAQWSDNRQLVTWVRNQRNFFRAGRIHPQRKARLDALGFEWKRKGK
jgi:hypothetical protein